MKIRFSKSDYIDTKELMELVKNQEPEQNQEPAKDQFRKRKKVD